MKRFLPKALSDRKGIKPPPGYKTSISICRKFPQRNKHPRKLRVTRLGNMKPNQ